MLSNGEVPQDELKLEVNDQVFDPELYGTRKTSLSIAVLESTNFKKMNAF